MLGFLSLATVFHRLTATELTQQRRVQSAAALALSCAATLSGCQGGADTTDFNGVPSAGIAGAAPSGDAAATAGTVGDTVPADPTTTSLPPPPSGIPFSGDAGPNGTLQYDMPFMGRAGSDDCISPVYELDDGGDWRLSRMAAGAVYNGTVFKFEGPAIEAGVLLSSVEERLLTISFRDFTEIAPGIEAYALVGNGGRAIVTTPEPGVLEVHFEDMTMAATVRGAALEEVTIPDGWFRGLVGPSLCRVGDPALPGLQEDRYIDGSPVCPPPDGPPKCW